MTTREARTLLNCSPRQLHYLLASEGIRAGQRSHAGELTPQATAAVQRLYLQRSQTGAPASRTAQIAAPVSEAAPAPWAAYEELQARVIQLEEETRRLKADMEHDLHELHNGLLCVENYLSAPKSSVRGAGGFWRAIGAWFASDGRAQTVAQDDYPATEIYYANTLRRAETNGT